MVRRLEGRWWRVEVTPERKVRSRLELAGSIAVLAVLAFACAHGFRDPNSRYANQADADKPRHFMVLPINLTIKTPPEFSPVLDDIFGAIVGYIRDRGDTIEAFSTMLPCRLSFPAPRTAKSGAGYAPRSIK